MDFADLLKRFLRRRKELFRVAFYTIVIEISFLRIRDGYVSASSLKGISVELGAAIFLAVLLGIVFWHFALYEPIILSIKDILTRKLGIDNYRHWINQLEHPKNCLHFDAEKLYGHLKWECKDFHYPHDIANYVTPALHALYLLPLAWLCTLFWHPQFDWVIVVAFVMIPGSFATDIGWERTETFIFKRQAEIVKRELALFCKEGATAT